MTRAGLLAAILVVGFTVAGVAQQQRPRIPPTGAIKKVKDNLYVVPGAGGNTTVFVTRSGIVLVDNTPPSIEGLAAAGQRLKGIAQDGIGPISRIEVSVAGSDEWFPYFPADGIFDEQREELDIDLKNVVKTLPALVSVRVYDKANNFVVRSVYVK